MRHRRTTPIRGFRADFYVADAPQRKDSVVTYQSWSAENLPARQRLSVALGGALLAAAALGPSVAGLFSLAVRDERYTHVLFVPVAVAGLLFLRRGRLPPPQNSAAAGAIFFLLAATAYVLSWLPGARHSALAADRLTLTTLALVLAWISAFSALWGWRALRTAGFECLLLFATVPLPESWVGSFETFLQLASADATHVLLRWAALPVFREGLHFTLPGVTIEIARECSGIRSSNALLLAALVLGRLFLRSPARQVLFLGFALLVAVLKNALRISTLAWLGTYVSRDYLSGDLHHRGGALFFAIGLAALAPLVLLLQRGETRAPAQDVAGTATG